MKNLLFTQNRHYFRVSFVLITSLLWLLVPSTTIQLREAAAKVVERTVSAPLSITHNRPMQQNDPACNTNAANTCVDFGNPDDEAFHNLVGWDNIQTEFPLAPPSGDNTVHYPSLNAITSFELYVPTFGASYLMTIETHDGVCDDSFSVGVNGQTSLYNYYADDAYGSATHEILLDSNIFISTTIASVTIGNLATDDCGKSGLYRAWIEQITTDNYEPNSGFGDATFINSGEYQQHTMSSIGDLDYFVFNVPVESAIRIETSGTGAFRYDTVINLYDDQLNSLEQNDDGGYGLYSLIDRECGVDALTPGTYYISVRDYLDDNEFSYTANYTVIEECGSSTSSWNLIENFNNRSLGNLDGQGGWVSNGSQVTTIPSNTGQVALIDEQEYLKRDIGPQSNRITLHSCMYQTNQVDALFGLSDRSNPTEFSHFEVQVGTNWHSNAALIVRDGSNTGVAQRRFLMDEWLHIWYVIDSTTNTFQIYASNYEGSAQIINIVGRTVFNFRNGRNNPLQTLFVNTGVAASGSFYLDDIYISDGINLTIPDSCIEDINVPTNLPDLEVVSVSISAASMRCEDSPSPLTTLNVVIANNGTADAGAFEVSAHGQDQLVDGLAAGGTIALTFEGTSEPSGFAIVDPTDLILESDESNNSWNQPVPIPTPVATCTPTPTPTSTTTNTPVDTPTFTSTPTNTPIDTPTFTSTPTNTPIDTPTFTSTPTNTPIDTPTFTSTPTNTPIDTPTFTSTPTNTPIDTPTFTSTPTNTPIDTPTPKPTVSNDISAYEPNDTPQDANIINSRQQQLHTISPAADQDYVQFVLNAESAVQIFTSGGIGADTQLYLYDDSLNEIDFNDDIFDDGIIEDELENQGDSLIQRNCGVNPLPAGTYYIRIEGYENASEFDYTLDFLVLEECAQAPSTQERSNRVAYLPMVVKIDPVSPTPIPIPTFTPSPVPPSWQQVGMENIEFDVIGSYLGYILAGGRNAEAGTGTLYMGTSCFSSSPTNIPTDAGIRDIAIADDLRSLIATENKAAFYTTDLTRVDGWTSARLPDDTGSFVAAISPNDSWYVSTDKGVFYSSDNGDNWTLLTGTPELINAFGMDDASGILWIGSYGVAGGARGDGIVKLDTVSNQFTPMNGGLTSPADRQIRDFALGDASSVYVATDHGVYSLGGDNSWNRIGLLEQNVLALAVWNNRLFATVENGGVWFAPLNNLASWQLDTRGIPTSSNIRDLHVDTSSLCGGLLAATNNGLWVLR